MYADENVIKIKHDVMYEVAKLAFAGELDEKKDQIAFQLIRMLEERNIRVPEDVSVISIDDSDLARHSEVPITSLPHPKENLGKKAAETLLQMIAGKKKDLTYEFDTRVVERESVAEHKSLRK